MTNATKKPGDWSTIRQQLASWDKPELLALVKDLYEAAGTNRDFIQARCQAGEGGGEALERYRGKIVEEFFPASISSLIWNCNYPIRKDSCSGATQSLPVPLPGSSSCPGAYY